MNKYDNNSFDHKDYEYIKENQPYTMDVEYLTGEIKPHGFHLGTDLKQAEFFVYEKLGSDFQPAISIALRKGKKLIRIYDSRDLEEMPTRNEAGNLLI